MKLRRFFCALFAAFIVAARTSAADAQAVPGAPSCMISNVQPNVALVDVIRQLPTGLSAHDGATALATAADVVVSDGTARTVTLDVPFPGATVGEQMTSDGATVSAVTVADRVAASWALRAGCMMQSIALTRADGSASIVIFALSFPGLPIAAMATAVTSGKIVETATIRLGTLGSVALTATALGTNSQAVTLRHVSDDDLLQLDGALALAGATPSTLRLKVRRPSSTDFLFRGEISIDGDTLKAEGDVPTGTSVALGPVAVDLSHLRVAITRPAIGTPGNPGAARIALAVNAIPKLPSWMHAALTTAAGSGLTLELAQNGFGLGCSTDISINATSPGFTVGDGPLKGLGIRVGDGAGDVAPRLHCSNGKIDSLDGTFRYSLPTALNAVPSSSTLSFSFSGSGAVFRNDQSATVTSLGLAAGSLAAGPVTLGYSSSRIDLPLANTPLVLILAGATMSVGGIDGLGTDPQDLSVSFKGESNAAKAVVACDGNGHPTGHDATGQTAATADVFKGVRVRLHCGDEGVLDGVAGDRQDFKLPAFLGSTTTTLPAFTWTHTGLTFEGKSQIDLLKTPVAAQVGAFKATLNQVTVAYDTGIHLRAQADFAFSKAISDDAATVSMTGFDIGQKVPGGALGIIDYGTYAPKAQDGGLKIAGMVVREDAVNCPAQNGRHPLLQRTPVAEGGHLALKLCGEAQLPNFLQFDKGFSEYGDLSKDEGLKTPELAPATIRFTNLTIASDGAGGQRFLDGSVAFNCKQIKTDMRDDGSDERFMPRIGPLAFKSCSAELKLGMARPQFNMHGTVLIAKYIHSPPAASFSAAWNGDGFHAHATFDAFQTSWNGETITLNELDVLFTDTARQLKADVSIGTRNVGYSSLALYLRDVTIREERADTTKPWHLKTPSAKVDWSKTGWSFLYRLATDLGSGKALKWAGVLR